MPIFHRRATLAPLALAALVACAAGTPGSPSAIPPASVARSTSTRVSATPSPGIDPNSTELATQQANLNATDLTLTLRDEPDPVAPGAELRYVVTVANAGPNPATATQLTVTLPDAVRHRRDDAGCRLAGATLSCELGEILARGARTVTIVVVPAAVGNVTVRAEALNRAGQDLRPADNAQTAQTTIAAP